MTTFETAGLDGSAMTLDDRDASTLTEIMTVLKDVGRVRDAPGLYLVVTESGGSYIADAHSGACECPAAEHRQLLCSLGGLENLPHVGGYPNAE